MYKQPIIANVAMASADTEYSYVIPANCKKLLFKLRGTSQTLKFCYASGASGTTYMTLPAGASKYLDEAQLTGQTLYFQSPGASQVLEVEAWI